MKQFKQILAFGDSFIAGTELNEDSFDTFVNIIVNRLSFNDVDNITKKLSFPAIIAEKLSLPYYNYAMTGGSNDRSVRKLIEIIKQYPDSLILFGYTATDRKELFYAGEGNNFGKDSDNFIQLGIQFDYPKANLVYPLNRAFVEHFSYPYNNIDQTITTVEAIVRMYNATVIHLPLFKENISVEFDNIYDFEGHQNFNSWGDSLGFKRTRYNHFPIEAHKKLANNLVSYIHNEN